ncbi:MAG: hypothetical protein AB7K86_26555 [Rhodospirillales bacterium]
MPLQNRVTPFGDIVAVAARGAWMGNRGVLHGDDRTLTRRRWTTRAWLVCRLDFNGRHRTVMTPRRYTELFFLDEATALAAGHRPCFECRRADFRRFRGAWIAAHGGDGRVASIDAMLHEARVGPNSTRQTVRAEVRDLPDGTMVLHPDAPGVACLVHRSTLRPWSFAGYGAPVPATGWVVVLTPVPTVAAIAAGYGPQVHVSAVIGLAPAC